MEAFFWSFLGFSLVCLMFGWGMSARMRRVPGHTSFVGVEPETISIIIPARNEEKNLVRLLPSLGSAEGLSLEVIVVDDQSEDRTASVAKEAGATVISGQPLPEGWYGKPWACQQGANAARGDWLLFLDSDTVMEAGGLARIAGLAEDSSKVYSICPYHRVEKPYEQLSAFFNVIMLLGMNAFTIRGDKAESIGLFGQLLFISRSQYEAVGGHETVKREVLENFHLSRFLHQAGYQCSCYLGRGTVSMRMFPEGIQQLSAGWSKGFASGADNTPKSALLGISFWLSGLIMTTVSLTFIPYAGLDLLSAIAGLYLLGAIQCLYLFRHAGSFSWLGALFFPVGLIFYQGLFFRALRRRRSGGKTEWKGRHVD